MIHVLFVDHAEALGGAEHSLLLLLEHLDRARFQPVLACTSGPLAERAGKLGVRVELLPLEQLRGAGIRTLGRWLRGVWRLAGLIRSAHIDVVHSNVMRASLYAAPAARLTRRALVWHVRDVFGSGLYTRLMSRSASATIAISRACAAPLPRSDRVHVIANGVRLDQAKQFGKGDLRQELGLSADTVLVGMVGRLRQWKGQDHFVRAMARVAEACPAARFVVVGGTVFGGEETYAASLTQLAESLGITASLAFLGQRDDLWRVLSGLDILVHCSIEPEPFGRVIIEGMAAGLPVVAYDHGGPSDIVVDGETGILVRPNDVEGLADAVHGLVDDGQRRARLGQAGQIRAAQRYEVNALTREIEAVLSSVVAKTEEG